MKRRFIYYPYILIVLGKISTGYDNGKYISNTGQVWGWGRNQYGQLGDKTSIDKCTPVSIHGANKTFCSITGGSLHTIGIDKNGRVWGWGLNSYGQLGDNVGNGTIDTPVSIHGVNKTFCQISAGNYHTIGIDKNGRVWGWGKNLNGQLGNDAQKDRVTPVSIHGANKTFCSITGGLEHTIGIDKNGRVWGWGFNNYGELGNNTTLTCESTPVSIHGANKTFCSIDGGGSNSIGIDKNGRVWGWGRNQYGELGDQSTIEKYTPVSLLGTNKTFCQISAGNYHTIGIDKNGRVWGWGLNSYGQLGDNTSLCRTTPISIHGVNKTFCQISAGFQHTIGIDKNGRVWGWGFNNYGAVGDNSIMAKCTPVMITTI